MSPLRSFVEALRFDGPPIDRPAYLRWGLGLAALKYAVEAGVIYIATGAAFSPIDFANPLLAGRAEFLDNAPEWLGVAWLLWTLPFVAAMLSLSARRAADAAYSQWLALLVVAPFGNWIIITLLALAPTHGGTKRVASRGPRLPQSDLATTIKVSAIAMLVGVVYTLALTMFSVNVLGDYGAALFFGGPVVVGATAGYLLNAEAPRSVSSTMRQSCLVLFLAMGALLCFAFEGVICLAMAAPLWAPLVLLGAMLGRSIALRNGRDRENSERGLVDALLVLPLFGVAESLAPDPPERTVATSVVIDAPTEAVWDAVIAFPPIDAPEAWYFRLGIASPRSARLEGVGVGATRYCVFTTGEFVEPITAWEAPRHLAFDVAEQPEPMFELTPYREIHPPHLRGALQSTRGEFRLEPLEGGRTHLTGRTWYQLRMAPSDYWAIWTDAILHRIHLRVLNHIQGVAEAESLAR